MPDFDLLLRAGHVVLADRVERLDVGIVDGRVAELGEDLGGSGGTEIDCTALHIFPGVIDSHVHFNEPGRAEWEGIVTGSRAVAAGGGVAYFDMPLNSTPPVLDRASFEAKKAAAEGSSIVDFGIWGGLTPKNLDRLEELRDCGVIGLKAFLCPSGIDDFPHADEMTLERGMEKAAELGLLVAVHAESPSALRPPGPGHTSVRDFLNSRPVAAEFEAIRMACDLAAETRCALHIVHVSNAEGVGLVADKKREGVDVTCETCPHYLLLSEDDMLMLEAPAKCAPPLRPAAVRDALCWEFLAGRVTTVGSDHSPAPPEMKLGEDFFAIWGGISSAQHLFPLMLDWIYRTAPAEWPLLGRCLATNVAERFRLPSGMGRIVVGGDANLALVDLHSTERVEIERLHYRHKITPYLGRELRGKIVRTILRGQTIACDGQASGGASGRLIVPSQK